MMTGNMSGTEKRERLEARIPRNMKLLIQRAAEIEGRTVSDFLISSAVSNAKNVIRENTILELSSRDQKAFAEALLNPPESNDKLLKAVRRHSARVALND